MRFFALEHVLEQKLSRQMPRQGCLLVSLWGGGFLGCGWQYIIDVIMCEDGRKWHRKSERLVKFRARVISCDEIGWKICGRK